MHTFMDSRHAARAGGRSCGSFDARVQKVEIRLAQSVVGTTCRHTYYGLELLVEREDTAEVTKLGGVLDARPRRVQIF